MPYVNDVTLVGRLAEEPARRPLPRGGEVLAWRLIIDRPRTGDSRRTVDTIPCATFDEHINDQAHEWRPGDLIEVHGALRRRFWNGDSTHVGRFEVEVHRATLLPKTT